MRHWVKRVLLGLLVVVTTITAYSTARALQVRADLTEARDQANAVQRQLLTGDLDQATNALPPLQRRLDRASGRTDSPIWAVTERLPLIGGNFQAVRRVASAAQILGATTLPEGRAALDVARRERVIRQGRVDLGVVRRLQVHVDRAAVSAGRAQSLVETREPLLLPPVGRGVGEARAKVGELAGAFGAAQRALLVAPDMLGERGPRRYFVAVQNNAEARATGGLIGAFALVRTDKGAITLERVGTNGELRQPARQVPSDRKAAKLWKDLGSTGAWYAANFTPHFPDVATNISGLWQAQSGQRVDGVVAIDPIVMRELLRATGPVRLSDRTPITAENVMAFVGHDEYVRYPDLEERKDVLSNLAGTLFRRVIDVREPLPMVQAFARVGQSGHFFAWSRHPAEQAQLVRGRVGGALPTTDVPYLSVLTQNFGGNKLDYFIRRHVAVKRLDNGVVQVDIRLRNDAPRGLPAYMTIRSDRPIPPKPYAQASVGLSVYGALSSEVTSVKVDGRPATMSFDRDHGHRMGTFALELPRGEEITVTVLMTQPRGVMIYRQQPLVVPDALELRLAHRVLEG